MSTKVSFLEKLGLNSDTMSSFLPQYSSPPRRSSYDHDLEELEPRPDDALLYMDYDSPKMPSRTHSTDSGIPYSSPRSPATTTSNGKGKGKAVAIAYQGRPGSWRQIDRESSFIPPIPPDLTQRRAPEFYFETASEHASQASIIDAILPRRTNQTDIPTKRVQVDDTFKEITRRERQMQKELQRLLDAQAAAVEKKLFGGQQGNKEDNESIASTPNHKSRSQTPSYASYASDSSRREKPSRQDSYVKPVRQPVERPLTLGQTRSRIIKVMRNLADLKEEEDAYIATAVAERKAGLSKLGTLKTRHQQIKNDIHEIETDSSDPLTNDIKTIQQDLHTVTSQIEEYKRLLRRAEHTKTTLERRLEEAKSEAESRLSGYKGALRECEAGIRDLVQRPNIRVLALEHQDYGYDEDEGEGGAGVAEQKQDYITGFEFFKLRPERRTLPMARDWWEGEVVALERRHAIVDKERAALEEGEGIWAEVIETIQRHEEQLTGALGSSSNSNNSHSRSHSRSNSNKTNSNSNSNSRNNSGSSSPPVQRNGSLSVGSPRSTPSNNTSSPEDVMRTQWDLLVDVIHKLERAHAYAEERGWTLLVAAVGAELSVYYDAREMLRQMLRSMGMEPPPTTPSREGSGNGGAVDDLVDMVGGGGDDGKEDRAGAAGGERGGSGGALMREELSGSVIRRWENPDDNSPRQQSQQQLGDYQQESTTNQQQFENQPILLSSSPPAGPPSDLLVGGTHHHRADETDNEHDDYTDNNEVPAGLLDEEAAYRDEESEDERSSHHLQLHRHSSNNTNNEVPPEFLSLHVTGTGAGGDDGHGFLSPAEEKLKNSSLGGRGGRDQLRRNRDRDSVDESAGSGHENANDNQVPLDLLSERRPGDDDGGADVD